LQTASLALHGGLYFELPLQLLKGGRLIQKQFENVQTNLSEAKPKKALL